MLGAPQRGLRALACLSVSALSLLWAGAASLGQPDAPRRAAPLAEAGRPDDSATPDGVGPLHAAVQRALAGPAAPGLARAEALLERSARLRPLHAPTWLARARLSLRADRPRRASRYARLAAALWPHRERLLWRVAVLQARLGERDTALATLRAYLDAAPTRMWRVAWFARRLVPDAERRIAGLVPVSELASSEADRRLLGLLRASLGEPNPALARAVWQRLSPAARDRPETAALRAEALLHAGAPDEAIAAWRQGAGPTSEIGIHNAGFESLPVQHGLGWRIRSVPGLRWERDPGIRHGGEYGLRISLEGLDRETSWSAVQLVAVEPGGRYRLAFHWRGEDVLSRAGPYLEVASRRGDAPLRAAAPARAGSWTWQRVELDFAVPPGSRLVELRIRRDPDPDLRRPASGVVWFDDLELRALPDGAVHG